jgi:hypothetical protein
MTMTQQAPSVMVTERSITICFDGNPVTVSNSDARFTNLKKSLKEKNWNQIRSLLSIPLAFETVSGGMFKVVDGKIQINGKLAPTNLSGKILEFMAEGLDFQPLVNFAEKLLQNPSAASVEQLFGFLEVNNHPITPDGDFIAYRKVARKNADGKYLDLYSRTIDNSPGCTPRLPRAEVDENPNQTCSYGLHVANWDYAANHYGSPNDVMMLVVVNPADVVAVPTDYNSAKMRVCAYRVERIVEEPLRETKLVNPQKNPQENTENSDDKLEDESDDWENEEEDENEEDEEEPQARNSVEWPHLGLGENSKKTQSRTRTTKSRLPLHSLETLKRMNTEALKNYKQRLNQDTGRSHGPRSQWTRAMKHVNEILKRRSR